MGGTDHPLVMPGLVPGIHIFLVKQRRGWPGHMREDARPGMTASDVYFGCSFNAAELMQ